MSAVERQIAGHCTGTADAYPKGMTMSQLLLRMFIVTQIAVGDLVDRVRNQDNERGATAVEYGLMVALIAGVIILAVTALGGKLTSIFDSVKNAMP